MMTSEVATCFGCGRTLQEGEGRYHVRPAEQYCSKACIEKIAPDVAVALQHGSVPTLPLISPVFQPDTHSRPLPPDTCTSVLILWK